MASSVEEYNEHDASIPENTHIQEEQQQNDHLGGVAEKRWPGWPGESVFRMLVPTHKVGGVIGRKGEFIKKMCEETKARIKILDGPPGIQERAVLISAKEEPDSSLPPAVDALLRVHKRAADGLDADASNARPNSGGTISSRLLVGATQAGSLIGKQGATIKSIQEASNCIIRVLGQDDLPLFALQDDRIVEIQGEPSGVHKAVELIASHLRKFLVDRSVIGLFEMHMQNPPPQMDHNMPPHQPWGPQGFPPNAGGGPGYGPQNAGGGPGYGLQNAGGGPGYGPHGGGGGPGYGPQNTGGGPGYGPQYTGGGPGYGPQNTGGAPGFGPSPQYGAPPRQHDVYYPPADLPPMEKQPIQGLSMYGRDASMGPHSSANAQPPQGIITQITQHMQVPLSYADAVIGNAGANISYIRRASGATITIQESRGVPGEMTVEINGTGSQVQAAYQLIQNSMAEAASSQQSQQNPNPANGPTDNSYATHGSVYQSPPSNTAQNPGSYGSNYNGNYGNNYGTNYGY